MLCLFALVLLFPQTPSLADSPDTEAPTITITTPTNGTTITQPGITVSGTTTDNTAVTHLRSYIKNLTTGQYWNGTTWTTNWAWFTVPIPPNGNWTHTATNPADGNYQTTAWAWDAAGNRSPNNFTNFTVGTNTPDTEAPTITITTPTNGTTITQPGITVSGTTTDNTAVTHLRSYIKNLTTGQYWNGTTWTTNWAWFTVPIPPNGNWTHTATNPADGNYQTTAWAWDAAGNRSPNNFTNFTVGTNTPDTEAPTITITTPTNGTTITQPGITVSGTTTDNTAVTHLRSYIKNLTTGQYWNGTTWTTNWAWFTVPIPPNGNWTHTATNPADGNYQTTAWAWDAAGNRSPNNFTNFTYMQSLVCWSSPASTGTAAISFTDTTAAAGLVTPLAGMHGHAAAWGDVNSDDFPDLVVGTFANRPVSRYQHRGATGPSPDTLLVGSANGTFQTVSGFPAVLGRTSGSAMVDLDNDGDQDVVLIRNMRDLLRGDAPSQIYRNDGSSFTLIDLPLSGFISGRSVGVIDYNNDGLLDLIVLEDEVFGANSSFLLKNLGNLQFEDVTGTVGFPVGIHGLGIATGDLNDDGHTDFFVAGSNRMFLGTATGFTEADASIFAWPTNGSTDLVTGAAFGDLNRDGRLDLVMAQHFNSTSVTPQPTRVFLNGPPDAQGSPTFTEVTAASGMVDIATKSPFVEIADFDNDGWPDILTTASAGSGQRPAVFRNLGPDASGVPQLSVPSGIGDPQYWVAAPTVDLNRDGRLDMIAVEWEPALPSLLLINDSASGNWLEVSLDDGTNTPVIGAKVSVWISGQSNQTGGLLGYSEIIATQGYTSGNLQAAHFGLGAETLVDVTVTMPNGQTLSAYNVAANSHIRMPNGCS